VALRELYRVHPGSAGEEVTLEGQGQPNLRAFAGHREDWELSKKVIDQSKIRWVISTFNHLYQQGLMELYLLSSNKESNA
jgi:hypothetical protein